MAAVWVAVGRPGSGWPVEIAGKHLVAEVKWLSELEVDKRLKGDYVWFKLALLF
jgi:hypothetical protein